MMRVLERLPGCCLLGILLAGWALADPPVAARPEEVGADQVLAALVAEDRAALAALASGDEPDPWLIADELLGRGAVDAARSFAAAAAGAAVEGLRAYVEREATRGVDAAARELQRSVAVAYAAGREADVARLLADAEALNARGDVGSIRRRVLRSALMPDTEAPEAARILDLALDDARRIGWWRRAITALHNRAGLAGRLAGGRVEPALPYLEEALLVARRIGSRADIADLQRTLGAAYGLAEDPAAAERALGSMIERHTAAGDGPSLAWTLAGLGYVRMQRARYAEAREVLDRALATLPAGADPTFDLYAGLAASYVLTSLGAHREALDVIARARRAQAEADEGDDSSALMWQEGVARTGLGDLPAAIAVLQAAVARDRSRGNPRFLATSLVSLAIAEHAVGDWSAARRTLDEALALGPAAGDPAYHALVQTNLGTVLVGLGELEAAREHLLAARSAHRRSGNELGVATTIGALGNLHARLGQLPQATTLFREARAIFARLGQVREVAASWLNEGLVQDSMGAYGPALAALERVRGILAERPDARLAAQLEAALGNVHQSFEDVERAERHFRAAKEAHAALGSVEGVATAAASLGGLAFRQRDFDAARRHYEEAAEGAGRVGDVAMVARLRTSLVRVDLAQGRLEGLEERLRTLAGEMEALGDVEGQGAARERLSELFELRGDLPGAEAELGDGLSAYRQAGALHLAFGALTRLAALRRAQGDPRGAVARAEEAAELLDTLGVALAEEEGMRLRSELARGLDVGVTAALETGEPARAHALIEALRAGTLLEALAGRSAIQASRLPAELHLAERAALAREAAAREHLKAARRARRLDEVKVAQAELGRAREARVELLARIQREQRAVAALIHPRPVGLDDVRAALRPEQALVTFHVGDARALALVVTTAAARLVDLGPPGPVTDAAQGLRQVNPGDDLEPRLTALRALVIAPLALPEAARTLLVSPDGALAELPLGLLVPDREVALMPSASVLVAVLVPEGTALGEGVLAVADPAYDVASSAPPPFAPASRARLRPLPGTREEARAVGTDVLLARDATEAGLRAALGRRPRWRAVHLGCHGLVSPDRPMLSCLALTADGEDDGYLTVQEIFQQRIPADLAVLSACESARGAVRRGEGVTGLPRAFLFAGPPRVLSSCWKVDDDATRALMVHYHALWNPPAGTPRLGAVAALRKAQEHVRSQPRWAHPYYWGAWVLWGLPE